MCSFYFFSVSSFSSLSVSIESSRQIFFQVNPTFLWKDSEQAFKVDLGFVEEVSKNQFLRNISMERIVVCKTARTCQTEEKLKLVFGHEN